MEDALRKGYDSIAEKYLSSRTESNGGSFFKNIDTEVPMMFSMVPQDLSGLKLLDIGCGPGIHLKEYVRRGCEGFGVDLSPKMIDVAMAYCPDAKFNVGNISKLQFKDNLFDIVTASFVLDHVENLEAAIKEVKRVLKIDGIFIFSVPHPISNMFRHSKPNEFIPTDSYFSRETLFHNIVGDGTKMLGIRRQLQDYFQPQTKNGFVLMDFVENQPDEDWLKKYENFNPDYLKFPCVCFFRWKKK